MFMRYIQIMIVGILLSACKKEYVDSPYNAIERFTVKNNNSGTAYRAVIKDDTLMVYWAQFAELPDSVSPEIIVSKNARITPASGEKVAFREGVKYTVVAQNGSSKEYVLKPLNNQPPPVLNIYTTTVVRGDYLVLGDEYFIPDTTQTKLYLVNTTQEIQIPGLNFLIFSSAQIIANIPADGSIAAGSYNVKLVTGKRTAFKGPIEIQ